ncbi:MAG: hypothetical protein WB646_13680 [Steroidobacteraceae bacterium]
MKSKRPLQIACIAGVLCTFLNTIAFGQSQTSEIAKKLVAILNGDPYLQNHKRPFKSIGTVNYMGGTIVYTQQNDNTSFNRYFCFPFNEGGTVCGTNNPPEPNDNYIIR